MQGGFALLEAGGVRRVSTVNIMSKNIADLCVGAMAWYLMGFGIAWGGTNKFLGTEKFLGQKTYDVAFWFFQFSFASATSTIDSGAVAERMRYDVYMFLSFFMTAWSYPVVVHWVWAESGFLYQWGAVDFAGSGVVHLLGGVSGLVGTMWLGPRIGRYDDHRAYRGAKGDNFNSIDDAQSFQAHDPLSQLFGTLLLLLGWYAFNGGSTLALSGGNDVVAANVMMVTTLSAAAGGIVGMLISRYRFGLYTVDELSNGMLAGLVGITANCHAVLPIEAVFIGASSAVLCHLCATWLNSKGIDDPVSAISIHGMCGAYGIVVTGFFLSNSTNCGATVAMEGLFHGGGGDLLLRQFVMVLLIAAWSAFNTIAFLVFVEKIVGVKVRVSAEEELLGMDCVEHGVDHGDAMLQTVRELHRTLSTLEPGEREIMRNILKAFFMGGAEKMPELLRRASAARLTNKEQGSAFMHARSKKDGDDSKQPDESDAAQKYQLRNSRPSLADRMTLLSLADAAVAGENAEAKQESQNLLQNQLHRSSSNITSEQVIAANQANADASAGKTRKDSSRRRTLQGRRIARPNRDMGAVLEMAAQSEEQEQQRRGNGAGSAMVHPALPQ